LRDVRRTTRFLPTEMRTPMTELLYLGSTEAAYETRFTATIVATPPGGIVLDRTLFYPVGGGQPADRGALRREDGTEWPIADVAKVGDSVLHRLGRMRAGVPRPQVGDRVEGRVDWDRRYLHMRSHTAQHLLSARLFAMTGRRTRKAILGGGSARLELDGAWPAELRPEVVLADLERYVAEARPVQVRFVPRAAFDADPPPRSGAIALAPHVDPVRLIEIDVADRCPCGGTHLRNTSEIGPVALEPPRALPDGGTEVSFRLGTVAPPTPRA
jgi:misacylated tRNA(Ala) deacylase